MTCRVEEGELGRQTLDGGGSWEEGACVVLAFCTVAGMDDLNFVVETPPSLGRLWDLPE